MGKKVRTKHGSGKTMMLERKTCGEFKKWSDLPKKRKKTKKTKKKKKSKSRTQGIAPKHRIGKPTPKNYYKPL